MTILERYLQSDCQPIVMQVHEVEMLSYTLGRWRMHLGQQPMLPTITKKIGEIDALVLRLHATLPPKPTA
jgi:hypothetical protein